MGRKTMKLIAWLVAVLAVAVACAGLSATAFADDDQWVPVTNNSGHSFHMWQLFSGTPVVDNGVKKLVVEGWGNGLDDPSAFITALKADSTIGSYFADVSYDSEDPGASAVAVARIIEEFDIPESANSDEAHAFLEVFRRNFSHGDGMLNIAANASNVQIPGYGYYIINDDGSKKVTLENMSMMRIVDADGIVINSKAVTPTLQKFVALEDVANDRVIGWQKAATTDETVQFKLVATLPPEIGNYDDFNYTVVDVTGGLVIPDTSTVRAVLKTGEAEQVITQGYMRSQYYGGEGAGGEYTNKDPISMVFSVYVDDMVQSGSYDFDEDSTIEITYTGTIPVQGNAAFTSSARMHYGSSTYGNGAAPSAYTPYVGVRVVKPDLVVMKRDMNKDLLAGAEFALLTVDDQGVERTVKTFTVARDGSLNSFLFEKMGDGKYILRETKTPDDSRYDYAADVKFVLTSEYDETGTDFTGYSVTDWEGAERSDISVDADFSADTVAMSLDVVNWDKGKSPIELPETGGAGTIAFYAAGGILVLGAGIVLVARKRSRRSDSQR